RRLHVPLRPRRLGERRGRARQEVADHEAGDERDDEAGLAGERQRPRDAEACALVGRRRDVGVVAREPAEPARPEDGAEARDEAADVEPEGGGAEAHGREEEEVGEGEAHEPGERGVRLRDGGDGLRGHDPDLRCRGPPEDVDAGQYRQRQRDQPEADPEGPPVLGPARGPGHAQRYSDQRIRPSRGLEAAACSRAGMRPARNAFRPASTARRIASAMRIGSFAPAIAVFMRTPSQPSSSASDACDAVPTPASTITGTRLWSTMMRRLNGFRMPSPEPIGAASGITAAQPISSRRLHATGSSVMYGRTWKPPRP